MLEQVRKPETLLRLGPVDISALKALIRRIPESLWDVESATRENDFWCFHHTRHIVFRFFPADQTPAAAYANPIWHAWRETLEPVLNAAARPYHYAAPAFPKVMLARLAAGQQIARHIDAADSNRLVHKIHIPLMTNDKARMYIQPDWFKLEEGVAYEVNNIIPHMVENCGPSDRIHLIFELYNNKEHTT